MATAPNVQTLTDGEITRRTNDIISALSDPMWTQPLSTAAGSDLAVWVFGRALAPFNSEPPDFAWVADGEVSGIDFPNVTIHVPVPAEITVKGVKGVKTTIYSDAREQAGLPPLLTIGIHCTEPPHTAEVYVEVTALERDGRTTRIVHPNRTRVDVASPLGCTMYVEPDSEHRRVFPLAAPIGIAGTRIGAAVTMGVHLANRLANHYRLAPVLEP